MEPEHLREIRKENNKEEENEEKIEEEKIGEEKANEVENGQNLKLKLVYNKKELIKKSKKKLQ